MAVVDTALLAVISRSDATPIGIVTLHNIIRLQSQLADTNREREKPGDLRGQIRRASTN
jgi:hypothetical protein